jgi:prepilin-type processing-associated H-X9-DG protein
MEQGNLYNQFNFAKDIRTNAANAAARVVEVKSYLCPSDPELRTPTTVASRNNYYSCIGTTADPNSTDPAHMGVFNYPAGTVGNLRIVNITDGTSNTAMWSETKRATVTNGGCDTASGNAPAPYDPTNIYIIPATDPGWNLYTPMYGPQDRNLTQSPIIKGNTYHCNAPSFPASNTIAYRGCEYYRGFGATQNYTHTVPPNYQGYDCGANNYAWFHIAARSYHTGGVNVCFVDGSVHFIADAINFGTWQALGTRAAGDLLVTDF